MRRQHHKYCELAPMRLKRAILRNEAIPCPNCKELSEPHFMPPSLNEQGFYICVKKDDKTTSL